MREREGGGEGLTSGVVVYGGLGKHSKVLELRLSQRGAVVGDDDQLRYKMLGPFLSSRAYRRKKILHAAYNHQISYNHQDASTDLIVWRGRR